MKKGFCKICNLDPIVLRILEKLIKNEGQRIPTRRTITDRSTKSIAAASTASNHTRQLSADQVCYIIFLIFDVPLERHTIYRHKKHM